MSDDEAIKLLSKKPFCLYTPEDYKLYVRSLFHKKAKKPKTIKIKKPKPPFIAKLTKTGKVSLKMNRSGGWLSREELAQISRDLNVPENEVWTQLLHRKKNPLRLSDAVTEEITSDETNPLPF